MKLRTLAKGWPGELKTKLVQSLFLDSEQYRVFNNIIIQSNYGSTQIDHIVVSRYGIFVVEIKSKSGYIYGRQKDDQWMQVFFKAKYKFPNPLKQNFCHTSRLSDFLGVDHSKFHSVIIFWGDCHFKTKMPENVLYASQPSLANYIKIKKDILLTEDEVNNICHKLQKVKYNSSFLSGWHHMRSLIKRYESTTIFSKCG